MDSSNSNEFVDQCKNLIKYLNEQTKKYKCKADANLDVMKDLGIDEKQMEEIAKETGLDKATTLAQKYNLTNAFLEDSSVMINISNSVTRSLEERDLQRLISNNIEKLHQQQKHLEEFNLSLKRELEDAENTKNLPYSKQRSGNIGLRSELNNRERDNELIHGKNEADWNLVKNTNWPEIVNNVKKMNTDIEKNVFRLKEIENEIKTKYDDLPPSIYEAKQQVAECRQQCKDVEAKFNALVEKSSNS